MAAFDLDTTISSNSSSSKGEEGSSFSLSHIISIHSGASPARVLAVRAGGLSIDLDTLDGDKRGAIVSEPRGLKKVSLFVHR